MGANFYKNLPQLRKEAKNKILVELLPLDEYPFILNKLLQKQKCQEMTMALINAKNHEFQTL